MPKTLIVLQCRMASKRLPGKALKLIKNIPTILICYKRLSNTGHKIIVATSNKKSNTKLIKFLENNKIDFFAGSEKNVLSRYLEITKNYKPEDYIVRATADNILPDGLLVDILLKEIKRNKLNYFKINKKKHFLPKGFTLEIFKLKELIRISKLKLKKKHLEHVTLKMYENKKNYEKIILKKLIQKKDLSRINTSIDTKKDYLFMKKFFNKIKNPFKTSSLKLIKHLTTV